MLTLDKQPENDLFRLGSFWQLNKRVNGYAHEIGNVIATQASEGRSFEVIGFPVMIGNDYSGDSLKVRLLEDGYICWFKIQDLLGQVSKGRFIQNRLLSYKEISTKIVDVLNWIEKCATQPNKYLWGGTVGPDFDCSGLVQAAFSTQGIWLPRDAYQQESFCKTLPVHHDDLEGLCPGDLLFFGTSTSCDHVGVYKGNGAYWHSSGKEHGRNGIGSDKFNHDQNNPVASYYRAHFRGAGRVECCHDGTTLP